MAGNRFTKAIAKKICDRIAAGESLRSVCEDSAMPSKSTVLSWVNGTVKVAANAGFPDQYERARKAQADAFADEIVHIADTEVDPQKARVRIDARRWVAGKQRPKKYGDKVNMEHTGKDGGPIQHEHGVTDAMKAKLDEIYGGGKNDG